MRPQGGFSLTEVLVATCVLVAAVCSVAPLFTIATSSNIAARATTEATVLAQQKVEELRALTWAFGPDGRPLSDMSTNTAVDPQEPHGGTGLSPSPATALTENTPGFVDYVDRFGVRVGHGAPPRGGVAFTRRWAIDPLPASPDTIVIQVRVMRSPLTAVVSRLPDEARITTIRTRRSW